MGQLRNDNDAQVDLSGDDLYDYVLEKQHLRWDATDTATVEHFGNTNGKRGRHMKYVKTHALKIILFIIFVVLLYIYFTQNTDVECPQYRVRGSKMYRFV